MEMKSSAKPPLKMHLVNGLIASAEQVLFVQPGLKGPLQPMHINRFGLVLADKKQTEKRAIERIVEKEEEAIGNCRHKENGRINVFWYRMLTGGRVELKRIENKINRQVTFAKRRNGLLKKAYELSVLCEAEVALIVFSTRGKLYEFCSTSSMLKTLERYQKCSYGPVEVSKPAKELETSYREYLKLKTRFESLQRTQRNLLGEDLGPLNTKELEQLERQLDSTLKQVRSSKTQFMLDQLADLQNKEHMLVEANRSLTMKLEEMNSRNNYRQSWEADDQSMPFGGQQNAHSQGQGFFQPLECNPTLQIGYNADQISGTSEAQQVNGFIPGWML
ncbi:hypothetical protein RJT34_18440 [Clitoria ternatea]|uniref:Uncharacterized protein n=1 Tax=Clitoria ternatea TaxID=43366 RepID=A0AAN9JAT1_CLITE